MTHPARRGQPVFGTHRNRSRILFASTVWYFFTRSSCQATCALDEAIFASSYCTCLSYTGDTVWSNPVYKWVSFLRTLQLAFICILIILVLCMVTWSQPFCVVFFLTFLLTYKKSRGFITIKIQGPPKKCVHTLMKENSTLYNRLL